MFRKTIAVVLVGLLLNAVVFAEMASATSKAEKQARFALKVKANLEKLGVGEDTRVVVKLRDKTKVAGYLSAINEESFSVTSLTTGTTTSIAYAQVKQVKGHNLTTGQQIAVAVIVGLVIAVIIGILLSRRG